MSNILCMSNIIESIIFKTFSYTHSIKISYKRVKEIYR